jgi:hypothetical protein
MTVLTASTLSTLEQIHSINLRAVFGGSVFILCCLIAASLFKKNARASYYVFLVLISAIGLVSGVLIASSWYVAQNPDVVFFWSTTL